MNRVTVMARMINPITVPVPIQTFWKYTLTRSCRGEVQKGRICGLAVAGAGSGGMEEERKLIFKQYQVPLNRGSQPGLAYDEIIYIHGVMDRILFSLQEELDDEHGIQQNHVHELIIRFNVRISSCITAFDVIFTIINDAQKLFQRFVQYLLLWLPSQSLTKFFQIPLLLNFHRLQVFTTMVERTYRDYLRSVGSFV
uniref:Uncharacterized protein n=1 Tax=Salix viminalis TaxID=40686 RepID=A0A6N2NA17_SALVM